MRNITLFLIVAVWLTAAPTASFAIDNGKAEKNPVLKTETDSSGHKISRGVYRVFENRQTRKGKQIGLNVIILHSFSKKPSPYPLVLLAGGPGVAATIYERAWTNNEIRQERDIVLVALRGTGGDNRLHCPLNADGSVQGYMDSAFNIKTLTDCRKKLSQKFDLSQYTNPNSVDDLEDLRKALGYKQFNLMGYSGGTRVALVYMNRHPNAVRSAILNGVVPFEFKNPLFHASASQKSLDKLFEECENNPNTRKAYPNFKTEFYDILMRLEKKPVQVSIKDPSDGKSYKVTMDREDFAEAVRFMLYRMNNNRRIPYLVHRAYKGDYTPFAQLTVANARGLDQMLSMGLLLCVTCTEDVARISEAEILKETKNTFLGDTRVREQKAVCDIWPKTNIGKNYAKTPKTNIPVLLLSGTLDPVTPPEFASFLDMELPNSRHLVVPGVHGVMGPCLFGIQIDFLRTGSFKGLNTECTRSIKLPPIYLPKEKTK